MSNKYQYQLLNEKKRWTFDIWNLKLVIPHISGTGFTLIELIIYMGLMTGFLVMLSNIFGSILSVRVESQASSSVEQDGRFILARLAYDVNRATVSSVPNTTTLVLTIGGQAYTYSLNGSKLQLVQPAGTDLLNSSGSTISGLTFQRLVNTGGREDTIKAQFTLNSVSQRAGGSEVRSFNTTIGRRIR